MAARYESIYKLDQADTSAVKSWDLSSELGFHAVENRHYVTDVHATLFRLLGLDARRLEIPGRKRLEIDFGESIDEIIA